MTRIHPTAVVDPGATLGEDVEVGAHCVVGGSVTLGRGCVLHPHVTLAGLTVLGEGTVVFPGAVLGMEPQDLKHRGEATRLEIGAHNRIREHVTMHPGTAAGGGLTRVGSGGLFMVGCHVAHDCRIDDGVILANHVLLAGHVRVGERAILNGAAACHHFATIGRLAYVGGLTRVTQDVHPFTVVEGHPCRVRGANVVGLQRAGFSDEAVRVVRRAVFELFLGGREACAETVDRLEREHPGDLLLGELLASIRAASAGRQGRAAEALGRVS